MRLQSRHPGFIQKWLTLMSVSPARKRQRLSSPDYDRGLWEPDDDAIQEISRIELTLSQLVRNQKEMDMEMAQKREEAKKRRLAAIMAALGENSDTGNTSEQNSWNSLSQPNSSPPDKRKREEEDSMTTGHQDDRHIVLGPTVDERGEPSSTPEDNPPPEPDYADWFESTDSSNLPGFQKLSKIVLDELESSSPASLDFPPTRTSLALSGFAKASITTKDSTWIEPSKDALERAARKMRDWATEDEVLQESSSINSEPPKEVPNISEFSRPALAVVSNAPTNQTPVDQPNTPDTKTKSRAFKSPLAVNASSKPFYPKGGPGIQNMPMHYPGASRDPVYVQKFGRTPHPLSSTPITATPDPSPVNAPLNPPATPKTSKQSFSTPVRHSKNIGTPGSTKKRQYKTSFTTPFKPGMRPGEPGHVALRQSQAISKHELHSQRKPQGV